MPRPSIARTMVALLAGAAVLWPAQRALAEGGPKPPPAAQSLFDEAAVAMDRKDYEAACPKLEEVVRLVPDGIGAKLTLAECYEGAGRLASAWAAYRRVEASATGPKQGDRRKLARERGEVLRRKLATLTISVPARIRELQGVEILRDGVPVPADAWNSPIPVDKGDHVVRANAPGRAQFETSVGVAADGVQVVVQVEGLQPSDLDKSASAGGTAPIARPAVRADATGADGAGATQRALGVVVGTVGLAAAITGGVFGIIAIHDKNQSDDGPCLDDGRCTAEGLALRDRGRTFGTWSTALFIAGGASLAVGVVLFATAPHRRTEPSAALVVGPGNIALVGRW